MVFCPLSALCRYSPMSFLIDLAALPINDNLDALILQKQQGACMSLQRPRNQSSALDTGKLLDTAGVSE